LLRQGVGVVEILVQAKGIMMQNNSFFRIICILLSAFVMLSLLAGGSCSLEGDNDNDDVDLFPPSEDGIDVVRLVEGTASGHAGESVTGYQGGEAVGSGVVDSDGGFEFSIGGDGSDSVTLQFESGKQVRAIVSAYNFVE